MFTKQVSGFNLRNKMSILLRNGVHYTHTLSITLRNYNFRKREHFQPQFQVFVVNSLVASYQEPCYEAFLSLEKKKVVTCIPTSLHTECVGLQYQTREKQVIQYGESEHKIIKKYVSLVLS